MCDNGNPMQVGPYSLLLRQRPEASGNTAHLRNRARHEQVWQRQHTSGSIGKPWQQSQYRKLHDLPVVGREMRHSYFECDVTSTQSCRYLSRDYGVGVGVSALLLLNRLLVRQAAK